MDALNNAALRTQYVTAERKLTPEQERKLEALKDYPTRYEVEMVRTRDSERGLLCYTSRLSRRGLIDAMQSRADRIKSFLETGPNPMGDFNGSREYRVFPNAGVIRFTGRTQRDAIQTGELVFMGGNG